MKPYFNSPARIEALQSHALSLVGTPFAAYAMVPGAGIDCIHVNGWCYLKTGLFQTFTPPRYSLDSANHSKESQLLKWLAGSPQFTRAEKPTAGDTVCFRMAGLCEHHVGLMVDDLRFVHSLFFGPKKVILSGLNEDYYSRRVTAVFRPMEVNHVQ